MTTLDRAARVRVIMGMMCTPGGWQTGKSAQVLAEEWGTRSIAAEVGEASRRIREDLMEREELRAILVSNLQEIVQYCISPGPGQTRRIREAIDAIKTIAAMNGLNSQVVEHEMRSQVTAMLEKVRSAVTDDTVYDKIIAALGAAGGFPPEEPADGIEGGSFTAP